MKNPSVASIHFLFLFLVYSCAAPTVKISPPARESDACEMVNAAIAALPKAGGSLELPPGDYYCDQPMIVDRNSVRLIGAGSKQTIFHVRDSRHPVPLLIVGSTRNTRLAGRYNLPYPDHQTFDVLVKGIGLDGGFRFPAKGENDLECWDPVKRVSRACGSDAGNMIRNNGLTIRGAENIQVEDLASWGNYSGGIVTEKICRNLRLRHLELFENYFDGFAGYETTESTIEDFSVHHNGYSGISLDAEFEKNRFEKGKVTDNKDNGIFSVNVGQNTFQELEVRRNGNFGFYFENFRTADGKGVVGSCDGIRVVDSIVDMLANKRKKSAIYFGYPCQKIELKKLRLFHKKHRCLSSKSGFNGTITESTCSDGQIEKPLN